MNAPRTPIFRTTALTDAFLDACSKVGIDTDAVKLPKKREPTWRVTRRKQK